MSYQPKPGSLADRLCKFFLANPGESLTAKDIGDKFDVKPSDLTALLSSAITAEVIVGAVVEYAGLKTRMYSPGPKLCPVDAAPDLGVPTGYVPTGYVPTGYVPRITAPPPAPNPPAYVTAVVPRPTAATTSATSKAKPMQVGAANPLPPLDPASVKINQTVAKPARFANVKTKAAQYREWLDALQVGKCLVYPKQYQGSISLVASSHAKATGRKFSTAKISDTQSATWRDE